MQYVVRHKIGGGFVSSGHNNATVTDTYNMVGLENARAFPTIAGAKAAARSHLHIAGHSNKMYGRPPLIKEDYEIIEVELRLGNVVGDL